MQLFEFEFHAVARRFEEFEHRLELVAIDLFARSHFHEGVLNVRRDPLQQVEADPEAVIVNAEEALYERIVVLACGARTPREIGRPIEGVLAEIRVHILRDGSHVATPASGAVAAQKGGRSAAAPE